ncbi:MAG TPA: Flp family type IVb pilin [Kineosporiaceae bacterium]|nr:Flp family type IVb pilin [Kineosporiaceae bacterium]
MPLLRKAFRRDDRGVSAVEYGLLVASIAAVIVGVVFGLGKTVQGMVNQARTCIQTSSTTANCNALQAPAPAPVVP